MNLLKKVILIILGILLLAIISSVVINLWVKAKLPVLINENNKSEYNITYKTVDVSIWYGRLLLNDISIEPKLNRVETDNKKGIYADIKSIEVNEFNIWSVLFGNKIKAKTIVIYKPKIILYKNNEQSVNNYENINSKVIKPFENIVAVSNIYLKQGSITIRNTINNSMLVSVSNINFTIKGLLINDKTLDKKIPILFESYNLNCDNIYYKLNDYYVLKSKKIIITESDFKLKDIELSPLMSKKEFVSNLPKELDLFAVSAKQLDIKNTHWGFENERFYFNTDKILFSNLVSEIYRSKVPPDDLNKKKLYNELLRELDFDLKVDTLQLINSKIVYKEEKELDGGEGVLTFSDFNMNAFNIQNGYNKKDVLDTKIAVSCTFMKESELKVNWSFNVLDTSNGFKFNGSIFNFNTEEMFYFVKPYLNLTIKGTLDKVFFDFHGNDIVNKGEFALKYDDLEVVVYRSKNRYKVNKFLSRIGNLFIKDDSDNNLEAVSIDVKRVQEKSFYNFLWISILDGLKQILI